MRAGKHQNFGTVLRPLFQFMRFFLGEPKRYCKILRAFECILGSQRYSADSRGRSRPCSWRWRAIIKQASTQASVRPRARPIALMNRLAEFCFTGDPTVLRHSVIESFKTLPSIKMFGWPYDSGKLLNLRAGMGFIPPRRGGLAKPKGFTEGRTEAPDHATRGLVFHIGSRVAADQYSHMRIHKWGCPVDVKLLQKGFRDI